MLLQCEIVTNAALLDRTNSTLFGDPEAAAVVAAVVQLGARIERGDTDCLCCAKQVCNPRQRGPQRSVAEFFVVHPLSVDGRFLVCAVCRKCAGRSVPEYVELLVGAGGLPPPLRLTRIMDQEGDA
jgi:hypothetical protein